MKIKTLITAAMAILFTIDGQAQSCELGSFQGQRGGVSYRGSGREIPLSVEVPGNIGIKPGIFVERTHVSVFLAARASGEDDSDAGVLKKKREINNNATGMPYGGWSFVPCLKHNFTPEGLFSDHHGFRLNLNYISGAGRFMTRF